MNIIKSLLLVSLLAIIAFSCRKKDTQYTVKGDYMVVGWTGGFVSPDTKATYYLITTSELRVDNTQTQSSIPTDVNKFNFNTLVPTAKFEAVKSLLTTIPSELLSRNNSSIGDMFPDAGYKDVRASIGGTLYTWKFEADQTRSSQAIQDFVKKIGDNL